MTQIAGRVAIIAGGLSHERTVSLETGREVWHALRSIGVDAVMYEPDSMLLHRLIDDQVSICYIALHGKGGEDGQLQEALELLGIPFVGSSSRGCRRGWDKATARANLEQLGFGVPIWKPLTSDRMRDIGVELLIEKLVESIGSPMVVKPSGGGSAQGLSYVAEPSDLHWAIPKALGFSDGIIFERAIPGREISVVVYEDEDGLQALPPVEILTDTEDRFDYDARHDPGRIGYRLLDGGAEGYTDDLVSIAKRAHAGLGLRDLSRSDFVLDSDGRMTLLEVSLSPGLSQASTVSAALSYAGLSLSSLMLKLFRSRLLEASLSAMIAQDEIDQ